MDMDNASKQYSLYYKQLIRLEDEYPQKLKANSPSGLANVRYIHEILKPEDFSWETTDRVIEKVYRVLALTKLVLAGSGQFIKTGEHWWVNAKVNVMSVYESIVEMSLASLRLEVGPTQQYSQDMSTGMGGFSSVSCAGERLLDSGVEDAIIKLVEVFK